MSDAMEQITLDMSATELADWRHAAQMDSRRVEDYIKLVLSREMYGCIRMRGLEPATEADLRTYRRDRKGLKHMAPQVWRKSGGVCFYCRVALDPFTGWHIDHITPFSRGGGDEIENLTAACVKCSLEKNKSTVADFAAARFTKVRK